jgi:hypothetical protein
LPLYSWPDRLLAPEQYQMDDYIQNIIARVEPEILNSLDEIKKACPSAYEVCVRGYSHQIKVSSLDEIEKINLLYRERDRLNLSGESYEVDHKIPLFKGGSHSLENLQLLTCEEHRLKNCEDRKGYNLKQSTRQTKPAGGQVVLCN